MSGTGSNYSIRDEIQAFWSERAATFDQGVGHEIFSEAERRGWRQLLARHLGDGAGRNALDLASGTGVISHLLHDAGFGVTGADWSEAMLEQARNKAAQRQADIRFILRDAENTMEPRQSFDVITNRHLVWTLVDPKAAFAEWFALLRPGGKLLIVDANMGKKAGYRICALCWSAFRWQNRANTWPQLWPSVWPQFAPRSIFLAPCPPKRW
ncbi:class I SAM-dependent methyltransferase [Devosia rhodophyticola]|uniref:Class I SAM-dependent methyltransferase n=1 Tax=Devosia rhodophyticola TaxID=3026423 RepID=A0ABY7YZW7_9HYPH|nr:class I SAM-dependent methyltransferase [Devosia rhodophyticola]WDR06315.1 class I SAM-dependent methyltransferase [Devosia rhodophyticola]